MSRLEFKSQTQQAYDRGRKHGFWVGVAACLIGRGILDIWTAVTS